MNRLQGQKSLYLLQHATNPVDWWPYCEEAFVRAKQENKPIIISIGYSSCHWCHVMEQEVFENLEASSIMNENFICIKVDREERPDVDQYMMERIQAIGLRGGWPLNCFLTPEGKFFFGGTYYPFHQWMRLLKEIIRIYKFESHLVNEQVNEIDQKRAIQLQSLLNNQKPEDLDFFQLSKNLLTYIDPVYGGMLGAPKFPMPNALSLQIVFSVLFHLNFPSNRITNTLVQMRSGGIYDLINGGFFRYSVDEKWIVPHFEKMLYDNALLATVYAEAALILNLEEAMPTVVGITSFLETWMKSPKGGYYSAIDADNEEGEGRYYLFSLTELRKATADRFEFFLQYFRVSHESHVEDGKYILRAPVATIQDQIPQTCIDQTIELLKKIQKARPQPVVDPKMIVSWNAMTLYAFVKSWQASNDERFFAKAQSLARFLFENAIHPANSAVFHVIYEDGHTMPGFLEDYAWLSFSFLNYYCVSSQKEFFEKAILLLKEAKKRFRAAPGDLLFSNEALPPLHERVIEIYDNVTPSGNSVFCRALILAGKITDDPTYFREAQELLHRVHSQIQNQPAYMANWILAALECSDRALIIKIPQEKLKESYLRILRTGYPLMTLIPIDNRDKENLYLICNTNACIFDAHDLESIVKEINRIK